MKNMNYFIAILAAVAGLCLPGCSGDSAFRDILDVSVKNTVPVGDLMLLDPNAPALNDLVITDTDSSSITLEQPTLKRNGASPVTITAYIGEDGYIGVDGNDVTGYIAPTKDVTEEGCVFTLLDDYITYRIIVVAINEDGLYSVKQIRQRTDGVAPVLNAISVENVIWTPADTTGQIVLERPSLDMAGNPTPPVITAYIGPTTGGASGPITETDGVVSGTILQTLDVSSAGCTFTGLPKGAVYRIIAVADNGWGVPSAEQVTETVPLLQEPTSVAASYTTGKTTVTWTDPNPITEVDHLHVSWTPEGGTATDVAIGVQTCEIPDLPGQAYTFVVKAVDKWGNETAGASKTFVVGQGMYTYMGSSSSDEAYSIQETSDGGYIMVGTAAGSFNCYSKTGATLTPRNAYNDYNDIVVIKTDFQGYAEWYTFIGSSNMSGDYGRSIVQASDGGYILAGDTTGDISSLPTSGSTTTGPLRAYSSSADMIVVKLASTGYVEWYTFLGGSGHDYGYSIQETYNGATPDGYIVAGGSGGSSSAITSLPSDGEGGTVEPLIAQSGSGDRMLIIKLKLTGYVDWFTYLGTGGYAYSIARSYNGTSPDGYIIGGSASGNLSSLPTDGSGGTTSPRIAHSTYGDDMLVVKLGLDGYTDWYTFIGGSGDDYATSVCLASDGGYVVAGFGANNIEELNSKSPILESNNDDCLVVHFDSSGYVSWYTYLGTVNTQKANSIQQTQDGGYIVAGYCAKPRPSYVINGMDPVFETTSSDYDDMLLVKLTSAGAVSYWTYLGGTSYERANSIIQTSDGFYVIAGYSSSGTFTPFSSAGISPQNANTGSRDMVLVKLYEGLTF